MDKTGFTPKSLFDQLRKSIIGQDEYLKALSNAAWLHSLRYRYYLYTGNLISRPKNNILVIGNSGTGKTMSIIKLCESLDVPVILEDSSALTGAGWHGRSVYNICTSINNAHGTAQSKMFACIVLDEADKLFKANKANHNGAADCGFLPISNLLTFVAGGIVEDPESHCSMDTSNFMIICLGAWKKRGSTKYSHAHA